MKFYFAEVRNIKDPKKSGLVQIRKYVTEDSEQHVKDEHLDWAMPIMPSNSASTNRVGVNPTGLMQGSRVLILELDGVPMIMGSYYRVGPAETPESVSDSGSDSINNYKTSHIAKDSPINPNNVGVVSNNDKIDSGPSTTYSEEV